MVAFLDWAFLFIDMKTKKIKVDIFEWDIVLIELSKKDTPESVLKHLKEFISLDDELTEEVTDKINRRYFDGGSHYFYTSNRMSVILLYPTSSKQKRLNVLCHEKRHAEDRILNYSGVDDIETAGYLAGYLAEELI